MVGPNLRVGPDPWTQRVRYGSGFTLLSDLGFSSAISIFQ